MPLIETDCNLTETEFLASDTFRSLFAKNENPVVEIMQRDVKHILSHRVIYANFYGIELPEDSHSLASYLRVELTDLENYALPRLIHAFLEKYR